MHVSSFFINCHKSYVGPQDWLSRSSCKVPYQLDIVQDVLLINFPFTCFLKKVVHRPATLPKLESIATFPENQAKFPSLKNISRRLLLVVLRKLLTL